MLRLPWPLPLPTLPKRFEIKISEHQPHGLLVGVCVEVPGSMAVGVISVSEIQRFGLQTPFHLISLLVPGVTDRHLCCTYLSLYNLNLSLRNVIGLYNIHKFVDPVAMQAPHATGAIGCIDVEWKPDISDLQ